MAEPEPDSDSPKCPACRGRGWKLRRSRRAVAVGTVTRGTGGPARSFTCRDCDGSGTLPGPQAAQPDPPGTGQAAQ